MALAGAIETPKETVPREAPQAAPAEPEGLRQWKWSGDDLIRLGELGMLPAERRFELMDGRIIEIMPPGPPHASVVDIVADLLREAFPTSEYYVRPEKPLRLNPHFDPQPDIAVVRGRPRDYLTKFPGPDAALLVIEVAESSLEYDRGEKLAAYAAAGISDYWIVNLRDGQVEVYREPDGEEYRSRRLYKTGETLAPLAAPGAALPVDGMLGAAEADA